MRGFLLTEREASLWDRLTAADQLRSLLTIGVIGILAGLFMSHVRLHLGLSGHKAFFWITPIVTARLLLRCPVGATVATLGAAFTSLALGGHFAGGVLALPVIALAGGVLDVLIGFAQRRRLAAVWVIPLLGLGGAFANLLCVFKRLAAPPGPFHHYLWAIPGFWTDLASYVLCGFFAGLAGAALARGIRRR